MVFENSTLETMIVSQDILQDVMNKNGLVLGGAWDYERMTFDYKFEVPEGIFYLRMPGYAVEGDVGAKNAILQLMDPYMGKHYYPTGLEYGSDEHFPERLVDLAVQKIRAVAQDLKAIS